MAMAMAMLQSPRLWPSKPPKRGQIRAMAALDQARELRLGYDLKKGQTRFFHDLPSGLGMEVITQKADLVASRERNNPPLVFVHGSFHAAWCWAEQWMPFFSEASYDCYAVSLLGQGESDSPEGKVAGTLQTHTSDLADFIRNELESPPVLIGHSFGGLIAQSYISNAQSSSPGKDSLPIAGAVLLCSVPPAGNSGLVLRYLLKKPMAAIKVTLSLAAKAFATSLSLCKETFFSPSMEDSEVERYQSLMKQSSRLPLFDLRKLNASLPVPSVHRGFLEILVLGAGNDFIVDAEGLQETAKFYGVEPLCLDGVAHDMMLDSSWEVGAEAILSWLKNLKAVK
ncbi:alpha/beta-Hydrolases superfamily protein [Wolffia australiana]